MERTDILTVSSQYFDFLAPLTSEFWIEDIAQGLSNLCRFNGQCKVFYSVAQHSALLSRIVSPEHAMAGLLPDYQRIERVVEAAVFERFGIAEIPSEVKQADLAMLTAEQQALMPSHVDEWGCLRGVTPAAIRIVPWSPEHAYDMFITRFGQLGGTMRRPLSRVCAG